MNSDARRTIVITATRTSQLELQPGQRFALRYEIRQRLSLDAMGALYLAVDRNSGEALHIHIVPPRR